MRRARSEPASETVEGTIERLGRHGEGVLTVRGRSVYVPLTAPGDAVRAGVDGDRGTLLALLRESGHRRAPPCPHFGICGGCALQHVAEETYTAFKRESVIQALAQRGLDAPVAPVRGVPGGARRRAVFAFARGPAGVALGFHGARSHAVADIAACLVVECGIATALAPLRRWLAEALPAPAAGSLHVTHADNGLDIDIVLARGRLKAPVPAPSGVDVARLTVAGEIAAQHRAPLVHLGAIPVALPPRAFLQPTRAGEAVLQDWVREAASGAKRVCDLFSGLGTFALPLARTARVHAVDAEDAALAALLSAARHAPGLKPVTVEARDLARAPVPARALESYDAVVFDPPRAGAALQARAIAASRAARVVAVSCNPATFARDARTLADGGYRLDWVRPLDQFLYSAHIELVAQFTRTGA